jgi:hypothetical protein
MLTIMSEARTAALRGLVRQGSYLTWGFIQEKIMTQPYGEGAAVEYFSSSAVRCVDRDTILLHTTVRQSRGGTLCFAAERGTAWVSHTESLGVLQQLRGALC